MDKLSSKFSAALLCGGSLFCSVMLWVNEQTFLLGMVLAGVFVTGLEVSKYTLFVAAKKSSKLYQQFGYNSLAVILLILSILTSVAFFESGTVKSIEQTKRESLVYQQQVKQLDFINQQIEITQSLIRADAENNYRQRSYEQMSRLNELYDKQSLQSHQINQIPEPSTGINSVLVVLSNTLHLRTEQVRFFLFLTLAVLIDVSGVACLLFATRPREEKYQQVNEKIRDSPSEPVVSNYPKRVSSKRPREGNKQRRVNTANSTLSERASLVANKVLEGVYGQEPVVRNIIKTEGCRHDVVKAAFDHLIALGRLTKQGKQYVLQT